MIKRTLAIIITLIALTACGGSDPAESSSTNAPVAEAGQAQTAQKSPTSIEETVTEVPEESPAETTEPVASENVEPIDEGAAEASETADEIEEVPPTQDEVLADASEAAVEAVTASLKLNLNEAAGDEFQAVIPNFGDRMIREFLEYRPYISIQQFRREIGKYVDETQVAEYEQYVYVPVVVDESDAETLQQLPGVNETVAAELMAARPFGSNEAFLAKLAEYVSDVELAVAGSYLANQ